jgi:hypothetical protein
VMVLTRRIDWYGVGLRGERTKRKNGERNKQSEHPSASQETSS